MKVNALKIRHALGQVLETLKRTGGPIIIEKGREPVAVLISLKAFQERFIDYREQEKRLTLLEMFKAEALTPKKGKKENSLKILRELRYGHRH